MMVAQTSSSSELNPVPRWELTQGALEALLARLHPDPVVAGEKYEHLRRALLRFFNSHQMPDADTLVDEALDRIARKLESGGVIDDIPAFAHGVARLIRLESYRRTAAARTTTDEGLASPAADPSDEAELLDAALQRCLAELSPKDRDLILNYYVGTGRDRIDGRARLAATLGLSENALRLRAQRLRDRLGARAAQLIEQSRAECAWPH